MKYELKCAMTTAIAIGLSALSITAKIYELPEVDPADFSSPMDNAYLPMALDETSYVFVAEDEDGLIINQITFTTDTIVIAGVTCTVIYDAEWIVDEDAGTTNILEETDDWYAWDNDGNVWYFGEDTTEYLYDDEGNPAGTSSEGSWEAGVDGALPGILMLASPRQGLSYLQEFYEGEAEDMAKVLRVGVNVSVEFGDFENCIETKEWTSLDRGAIEHKYYAPGVGLVYIEELTGGKTVQVQLVDIF